MKSKLLKKVIPLILVCAIFSQLSFAVGNAAETKKWSLYYDPSTPSSEWITNTTLYIAGHTDEQKFTITSMDDGVGIKLYVPNAKYGGNSTFFCKVTDYVVTTKKGLNYAFKISYVETSKYVNSVKGKIVY